MLNAARVRRIATTLQAPQRTETLLHALPALLIDLGCTGDYTVLFTAPGRPTAEVCASTRQDLKPGTVLTVTPEVLNACLQEQEPTYLETPCGVARDGSDIEAAVLAPLRVDDAYGVLLLPDVVPASRRPLVAFLGEQLGLALHRNQLHDELQRRHAIDVAKLGVVAETGKVLHELDLDVVLAKLMELALSTVAAEVGCIALCEAEAADLACRIEWGIDAAVLDSLRLRTGDSVARSVVDRNRPFIVRDTLAEAALAPHPILRQIQSLAVLPLSTYDRVVGCLVVVNLSASSPQDLELLQTVVELSSTAIENAILHQQALEREALREQLRIAGDIQRGLLPAVAPTVEGLEIAVWNQPCDESGGDYYDFFPFDPHHFGFVVGDVTGHGIGAALMATSTRAFLRALVDSTADLGDLLARLNNLAAADFKNSTFVSLFFGRYDTRHRTLTYASAGHRPPLIIYRHQQDAFECLKATGVPVGIFPDVPYEQRVTAPLDIGDVILLLTDGVIEALSATGEWFGEARLMQLLRESHDTTPAVLISRLRHALRDFCDPVLPKDDITVLCCRITAV